ncbi:hypothetical protein ACRYCC_31405 [Actinomadura scrupuli]|uniref:hypothetical protein n=1 Tax=Actinomadura scrupuli TaxID=559629 RepID=UPI003D9605D1
MTGRAGRRRWFRRDNDQAHIGVRLGGREVQIPVGSVHEAERLLAAVEAYLDAEGPDRTRRVLTDFPELRTPAAEQLVSAVIAGTEDVNNAEDRATLYTKLRFLRLVRETGDVDMVFFTVSLRRSWNRMMKAQDALAKFASSGRKDDLRIAVAAWDEVLEDERLMDPEATHGRVVRLRHEGGLVLRHAFSAFGDAGHLERSLELLEEARTLAEEGSRAQRDTLLEWAKALLARYELLKDEASVDQAISALEIARNRAEPGSLESRIYAEELEKARAAKGG